MSRYGTYRLNSSGKSRPGFIRRQRPTPGSAVLTQVSAVINQAHQLGRCPPIRIKGFSAQARIDQDAGRGQSRQLALAARGAGPCRAMGEDLARDGGGSGDPEAAPVARLQEWPADAVACVRLR